MVPFDKISDSVKKAVIDIEDSSFYEHSGFDLTRGQAATLGCLQAEVTKRHVGAASGNTRVAAFVFLGGLCGSLCLCVKSALVSRQVAKKRKERQGKCAQMIA